MLFIGRWNSSYALVDQRIHMFYGVIINPSNIQYPTESTDTTIEGTSTLSYLVAFEV